MKILVIRFSSIGDIVLTSPVVRCLKKQLNAELHYLTKNNFKSILSSNPNIDKLHLLENDLSATIASLQEEKFDYVIDLHHNLRSMRVKQKLGVPSFSFQKLNFNKWLLVNLKINRMPKQHIVNRYLQCVQKLGVIDDGFGLDYFIPPNDEVNVEEMFGLQAMQYIGLAIGAQHATKRLPYEKLLSFCNSATLPIVLLGGKEDHAMADKIVSNSTALKIYNACGKLNLNQSASVVKQAAVMVSHDTGLMHIAAAFQKKTVSIWGNTMPDFGMYPYRTEYFNAEVHNLPCRPCSKIGYASCPKGHFKCMNDQNIEGIQQAIQQFLQK